jgi:hypothetical protein
MEYRLYNHCCKEWADWCEAMEAMDGEDPEMYPFVYCPFCRLPFTLTSPSDAKPK